MKFSTIKRKLICFLFTAAFIITSCPATIVKAANVTPITEDGPIGDLMSVSGYSAAYGASSAGPKTWGPFDMSFVGSLWLRSYISHGGTGGTLTFKDKNGAQIPVELVADPSDPANLSYRKVYLAEWECFKNTYDVSSVTITITGSNNHRSAADDCHWTFGYDISARNVRITPRFNSNLPPVILCFSTVIRFFSVFCCNLHC